MLERAAKVGLSTLINIFLNPLTFQKEKTLFNAHPEVFFVLGMHPCDGLSFDEKAFDALQLAFEEEPRLRAVGEIGLDYYWKDCPHEVQMALFRRQLHVARALEKPVVIHCREAEEDCLTILESHGFAHYPLLWHCFGADLTLAKRLVHNDWYVSVPGPVTYPSNARIREALSVIPDDRLLLETDCPYLSPVPWRGTRNEPAYTVFTVRSMAEARGLDPEELWLLCGKNTRRFFGID